MNLSMLVDEVSRLLDATVRELDPNADYSPMARAVASYVKNHKVNPRNLFDVIEVMWPTAKMWVREMTPQEKGEWAGYAPNEGDAVMVYDVQLPDESMGIIVVVRGLSIEWIVS